MEIRKINFVGSNGLNNVNFGLLEFESLGKLLVFSEGSELLHQEVVGYIQVWMGEYDLKMDKMMLLEDVFIRINDLLLERNLNKGIREYLSLSLCLIQGEKRWIVNFGSNKIVVCKREMNQTKFSKGIHLGFENNTFYLGMVKISKLEYKVIEIETIAEGKKTIRSRKVLNNEKGKHYVDFKKYNLTKSDKKNQKVIQNERILIFGREYGKFLSEKNIDIFGFINKNFDLDRVVENIEKTVKVYLSNKKYNNLKYNCLSGILIENN